MGDRRTILINSKAREARSSSTSDFYIRLQTPMDAGEYYLAGAQLPNVIYTVNSADDTNKIYFYENSTAKTASITAGYYTESSFPAAVKAALDTASGGFATFTVTISSTTKRMTVTSDQDFGLRFATAEGASRRMGFARADTATNATSHVGGNVIQLNLPMFCVVQIDTANSHLEVPPTDNAHFYVPIDADFGSVVNYDCNSHEMLQRATFSRSNVLRIKLANEDFKGVDLNGADWTLLIRSL